MLNCFVYMSIIMVIIIIYIIKKIYIYIVLRQALYHFPVIFKIRLTPIDANLRQQMRKSVKSASKQLQA